MLNILIKRYVCIVFLIFFMWLGLDYLNVVTSFQQALPQVDLIYLIVLFLVWLWANKDLLPHERIWLRVIYILLLTLLMVILSGLIIGGLVLMIHVSLGWKM